MEHKTDTEPADRPRRKRGAFRRRARPSSSSSRRRALELWVAPVVKHLGGEPVRMLGYNGSSPGPTLKVQEGARMPRSTSRTRATWTPPSTGTGCASRNRSTDAATQPPIAVGEPFPRGSRFPTPAYWYPRTSIRTTARSGSVRERARRAGRPGLLAAAHRELVLTLDDILLDDGKVAPFGGSETTYSAMGPFGDVLLVGGKTDISLTARLGEVLRLYLTNTASTREIAFEPPGSADETGRRRQRPRRARSGSSTASSSLPRSASSSTSCSTARATRAGAPQPERIYTLAAVTVSEEAG